MNEMYKYGGIYKKYNMEGDIHVGTGILAVHDIFDPIPDFMLEADTIFCDPPGSIGCLNSFYTKAEKKMRIESFEIFHKRFWEIIEKISPRVIFIEVFNRNKAIFIQECEKRYKNVTIYDSMYYRNKKNVCWIIQASNEPLQDLDIQGRDEEYVIKEICTNATYDCIGDPCMGKGLVAFYASKAGRKFVGTELNKYRLAVACERVSTGIRGRIN